MSIFTKAWSEIKNIFVGDVEPVMNSFLSQFASDEGKLILTTAIEAAPALLTGNFGAVAASVAASVISKSEAIAAQDATTTLQQVQSALQIAKVAANIQTPADQTIAASLSTPAAPAAPAPVPVPETAA